MDSRTTEDLLKIEGVVGVSGKLMPKIRKGKEDKLSKVIRVYVEEKKPKWKMMLSGKTVANKKVVPSTVVMRTPTSMGKVTTELIATDVVEIGKIEALNHPDPIAPMPDGTSYRHGGHATPFAGISVGHTTVTAGTLGGIVTRVKGTFDEGVDMALSNAHVFAPPGSSLGDSTWQPGPHDQRDEFKYRDSYRLGVLYAKTNPVADGEDAALSTIEFKPANGETLPYIHHWSMGSFYTQAVELAEQGKLYEGEGRTTGHRDAWVTDDDMSVSVAFGTISVVMEHCVLLQRPDAQPPIKGGDSGSIWYKAPMLDTKIASILIFAGSDKVGIGRQLLPIMQNFGVNFRANPTDIPEALGVLPEPEPTPDPEPVPPARKYLPVEVETVISVLELSHPSSLSVEVDPSAAHPGTEVIVTGRLTDSLDTGIPDRPIQVDMIVNDSLFSYPIRTDSDGRYALGIDIPMDAVGSLPVKVRFEGD